MRSEQTRLGGFEGESGDVVVDDGIGGLELLRFEEGDFVVSGVGLLLYVLVQRVGLVAVGAVGQHRARLVGRELLNVSAVVMARRAGYHADSRITLAY